MSTTIKSRIAALVAGSQPSAPRADALEGLKTLDHSDLPRWKSALQRGGESGYGCYLPYILAHNRPGRSTMLVGEDSGCLCIFIRQDRKRGSHVDLFLNPIPLDVDVAQRCLERANDFNGDRSARILRIDGNDAALAARVPGLRVRERREQYLYAPQDYATLSGTKYQTLRAHVNKIKSLAVEVVPYSSSFATACRELLRQWAERHRSTFGKSGGAGSAARALAQLDVLSAPDLTGEVALLGGRVVGYGLGGEIRPGLGCFLDSKSDLDLPGLGYFLRYHFLTKYSSFERVNDGSDARSDGLRQMKDSFRPVAMHLEYRGTQVAK